LLDPNPVSSQTTDKGRFFAMSRSRRKTPIFGITTATSERKDKQHWHRRWRLRERMALRKLNLQQLDAHMSVDRKLAGNVWAMAKDGRQYWPVHQQARWAAIWARKQTQDPETVAALQKHLMRRIMAK
jgi:hypothetical protein